MFHHQGAHQQPQWQQNYTPANQRTGPPPAKKQKGNPIITRYPPPPGYKGPAQPQVAFQQPTSWPPQGQFYNYGQQSYPGHPPQSFASAQTHQQGQPQGYPSYQQYPQAAFPPHNYYQSQTYSPSYPTQQPPTWPQSAQPTHASPPQYWNAAQPNTQQRRHYSEPSLSTGPPDVSMEVVAEQGSTEDDSEEDFYGECYFATHPDDIDPKLSLGMIEWKAPLPTKRPLPATFAEAELEAMAPRKPLPTDNESVSDYFVKSRRHEALLSIRQTEYWEEMKDDIIFKEFPLVCSKYLTLSELMARYKDRPDPAWPSREYSLTPEPQFGRNGNRHVDDVVMDIDPSSLTKIESAGTDERSDVLGDLDSTAQQNVFKKNGRLSRASSVTSNSSQKITRPTPLMPVRDQAQEDILASLGVTGSPKIVYQTPGPAISAARTQRDGATSRVKRQNSATSNSSGTQMPPPPPGYPHPQNASDRRRRDSDASQHTATGSDFEDNEATPRAKTNGKVSRKRPHEDSEDENADATQLLDNEETPKPNRKQQRVDDLYSAHRW